MNRDNKWSPWSFWKSSGVIGVRRRNTMGVEMYCLETMMKHQDKLLEQMRVLRNKVGELEMANERKEVLIDTLSRL